MLRMNGTPTKFGIIFFRLVKQKSLKSYPGNKNITKKNFRQNILKTQNTRQEPFADKKL